MWQDWINGILGLAIIGLAFMNLSGTTLAWSLGVIGVIIAALGFWAAGTAGPKTA